MENNSSDDEQEEEKRQGTKRSRDERAARRRVLARTRIMPALHAELIELPREMWLVVLNMVRDDKNTRTPMSTDTLSAFMRVNKELNLVLRAHGFATWNGAYAQRRAAYERLDIHQRNVDAIRAFEQAGGGVNTFTDLMATPFRGMLLLAMTDGTLRAPRMTEEQFLKLAADHLSNFRNYDLTQWNTLIERALNRPDYNIPFRVAYEEYFRPLGPMAYRNHPTWHTIRLRFFLMWAQADVADLVCTVPSTQFPPWPVVSAIMAARYGNEGTQAVEDGWFFCRSNPKARRLFDYWFKSTLPNPQPPAALADALTDICTNTKKLIPTATSTVMDSIMDNWQELVAAGATLFRVVPFDPARSYWKFIVVDEDGNETAVLFDYASVSSELYRETMFESIRESPGVLNEVFVLVTDSDASPDPNGDIDELSGDWAALPADESRVTLLGTVRVEDF